MGCTCIPHIGRAARIPHAVLAMRPTSVLGLERQHYSITCFSKMTLCDTEHDDQGVSRGQVSRHCVNCCAVRYSTWVGYSPKLTTYIGLARLLGPDRQYSELDLGLSHLTSLPRISARPAKSTISVLFAFTPRRRSFRLISATPSILHDSRLPTTACDRPSRIDKDAAKRYSRAYTAQAPACISDTHLNANNNQRLNEHTAAGPLRPYSCRDGCPTAGARSWA